MSYIHDFIPLLSPQRVCSGAGTWATVRIKKDYTEAFTQRGIYTEQLLHRHFCTQKLLHTEAFTHRSFCTHTPYKKKLLDTDTFNSLFTRKLLHRSFCTEMPLETEAFTHRSFYSEKPLNRAAFTHTEAFTQRRFEWNEAGRESIMIHLTMPCRSGSVRYRIPNQ